MKIAIGLGSSLGNRAATLRLAVLKLAAHPANRLLGVSRWYRTPPMRGGAARGWFLNAVALYETSLEPEELLAYCRILEDGAGRRRARHWGDRTLDLDLLVAEGVALQDEVLTLPHPGIASRSFVLLPLREVWPQAVDAKGNPYAEYPLAPDPRPCPVGIMSR